MQQVCAIEPHGGRDLTPIPNTGRPQVCLNESHWGPWLPMRGRCVGYRTEQQSCNAYFSAGAMGPHYVVDSITGTWPGAGDGMARDRSRVQGGGARRQP